MSRPLSHRQKFRAYNVPIEQAEARWQCQTCPGVIEHDDAIYCLHCRMYWEDVSNGIFDKDPPCKNCGFEIDDGHKDFCGMCREMGAELPCAVPSDQ